MHAIMARPERTRQVTLLWHSVTLRRGGVQWRISGENNHVVSRNDYLHIFPRMELTTYICLFWYDRGIRLIMADRVFMLN